MRVPFFVLTVATLIVSVSSTALTSVKTIYDPSQAYSANQQALIKLRSLHRQIAIVLTSAYVPNACVQAEAPNSRGDPSPRDKLDLWMKGLQDIEGAITPATVVAPNSSLPQTPPPAPAPGTPQPTTAGASPTPAASTPAPTPANTTQRPGK